MRRRLHPGPGHPRYERWLGAVTDARQFARLGIQTYGFTPMKMPWGFQFWQLAYAADERIPLEASESGAEAIYKLLQRFGDGA